MLSDPDAPPTAVIVNEFGALGIDGKLIVGASDQVMELRNGCICCEIREDLRQTAVGLLRKRSRWWRPQRFERLVVECSGLATPGPLIQTFLLDSTLASQTVVSGVITLAHAGKIQEQLAKFPEAAAQLACAELILLNHSDQSGDPAAAEAAVRELAPLAPLQFCQRAMVSLDTLYSALVGDPARWKFPEKTAHSQGILTRSYRSPEPLELSRIKMYLQFIAARRGWEVLRIKGIFRCRGMAEAVVAQGVYQWLELGPGGMPPPEQSGLVVIGRNIDLGELDRGWQAVIGQVTTNVSVK